MIKPQKLHSLTSIALCWLKVIKAKGRAADPKSPREKRRSRCKKDMWVGNLWSQQLHSSPLFGCTVIYCSIEGHLCCPILLILQIVLWMITGLFPLPTLRQSLIGAWPFLISCCSGVLYGSAGCNHSQVQEQIPLPLWPLREIRWIVLEGERMKSQIIMGKDFFKSPPKIKMVEG